MKLLILGAGGMAGHVAAIRLAELGHTVTGFARRKLPFCGTIVGDATTADLPEILSSYDAVINCIGVLNKAVDAEPHKGIWLNAYLPHLLAAHSKRVIHLSTDCVFSGHEGGGYKEGSFRSADTLYGRSKALGELNDSRNLTIRTSIVGPDINEEGIGLFNWFMKQNGTVGGYRCAFWSGVTTIVLANAIHAALAQNITGLYHLTNGDKISKYELLKLFGELRSEPVTITPSDAVNEDKSLICARTDFDFKVPTYAEMVRSMGEWIQTHGDLYTQYNTR
ncbi:NAD(P)-dependent oxidoreductase [Synergistales bacterium]|nr:NAD(P)-dependent oxidoreductase [Synergistales bacterium]